MKLILTDVDNTILQCTNIFREFLSKRIGHKPLLDHYDIARSYGISSDDADMLLEEFWASPLMGELPPEPCAREVLPRLYERDYRFVAITACSSDPKTLERRTANLKSAFGFEWNHIHCVGHLSKELTLQTYKPAIWVEDHFDNCVQGAKTGHRSFLINRSNNQDRDDARITRVDSWFDIEKYC